MVAQNSIHTTWITVVAARAVSVQASPAWLGSREQM